MNGFSNHGLSEDDFGSSKGGLRSFDAFPKTKATYLTRTQGGGAWTAVAFTTCLFLLVSEIVRWFHGTTTHTFAVEKGVSHDLQLNIDVVVAMKCQDLDINIQDASGDRVVASVALKFDPTNWNLWGHNSYIHRLGLTADDYLEEEDVNDYIGRARKGRKFQKSPRIRGAGNACRIYGSVEGNKVQGDFHITAKGHGYMSGGEHVDHKTFNFTHQFNELSFGPHFPNLVNPLDDTLATTEANFYKFQYYLSVVPTIYTTDLRHHPSIIGSQSGLMQNSHTVWTNQYAVTEQSHEISDMWVPGIFMKYDIEPITLTIAEEWSSFLSLAIRLVNVISGVLVAGGWLAQLWDWSGEVSGRGRGGGRGVSHGFGVLTGRRSMDEKIAYD